MRQMFFDILFAVRPHTHFRIKDFLTHTNALWCNFYEFVILTEVASFLLT